MCTKKTLITLIAFGVALGMYAQETATERIAGRELTEVQHEEQRISLPVDPLSEDSLVEVWTLDINTYIDTLRTITQRERTAEVAGDSASRKGHYVEIHAGAGIGNVGYGFLNKNLTHTSATGSEKAGFSGVVQLQYAYFFHKNVGVGVGAWLANYTSEGQLSGDFVFPGQWDSDVKNGISEQYTHHAEIKQWKERQTIHTAGVPVSLQFQAWGKKDKAGFFASLGAAPAFTVMSNYRVLNGEIEHWGEYPQRGGAQIHDAHEFTTFRYDNRLGKQNMKLFTATAFVDLGLLVKMSKQTDLLIGVYGHYTVMDIQGAQPVEIGWKDERFPNLSMEEYKGILATKCLDNGGALHPWQAGVKIGVHWHSLPKPRTTTTIYADTTLQMVTRNDTVWTSRIDTLHRDIPRATERVQREIDKLNRIYFAFDSHQLSEESMAFLQQIAEQLKTIPNNILIGGHASKEGTQAHNARLAHYRALMVKYYLVDCGIPATRMKVRDYGSSVTNAINLHEDLSLDRRVEIIVLDE